MPTGGDTACGIVGAIFIALGVPLVDVELRVSLLFSFSSASPLSGHSHFLT